MNSFFRQINSQFSKLCLIFTIFTLFAIIPIIIDHSALAYPNYLSDRTLSPIAEVSTRAHVPNPILDFDTSILINFAISKFGAGCPPEIGIYVHGWNKDPDDAREEFNRLQRSLNYNDYRIPVIGFSWNSKTFYPEAEQNAIKNGPDLAKFIVGLDEKCPVTDIHLLAHSLGSVAVQAALLNLDSNSTETNDGSKIITSVHLMGATLDNRLIVNGTAFESAIEGQVDKFFNLYSPEDDGLQFNQEYTKLDPLGFVGAPAGSNLPSNYHETNVAYEILPVSDADGDGNVEECFEEFKLVRVWGDNHCGYIGFRNSSDTHIPDDGAVNIVVRDWEINSVR